VNSGAKGDTSTRGNGNTVVTLSIRGGFVDTGLFFFDQKEGLRDSEGLDGFGDASNSFPFPLLVVSPAFVNKLVAPKDKPRRRRSTSSSPVTVPLGARSR
jgi:hypothetical protein